jgi:AraC-like DNA-binding protein
MLNSTPSQRNLARKLRGSDGIELTLTHYAAGVRQRRHEHDHVQVSFLLAGANHETIGRRSNEVTRPSACIKPIGTDHENAWGKTGALMLTVRLRQPAMLEGLSFEHATWRACKPTSASLVRGALKAERPADVDALACDLVGSLDERTEQPRGHQPPWLIPVIEAIWECDNLTADDAARIGGVHRVHLSRAFAQFVGTPFSIYRKQVMAARAVEAMLRTRMPLADVAALAGFADQSHMHRTIAALAGTTPKSLRQKLS